MTRHGPLTSQALGRSPYDDVVQGTEEGDPRAPLQMYDERGRPVNPETRRINRDIIRSHNEVMQVIGVAEPENGITDSQAEIQYRRQENEDRIGLRLLNLGRTLEIGGVWGVNGIRQRILIYRRYANIPFYDLYRHERAQGSLAGVLFTGFPAFATSHVLKQISFSSETVRHNDCARFILFYARLHLQIYVFLQRMGLSATTSLLPSLKYFIPFTDSSPIPRPPPLITYSLGGIIRYMGGVALSLAPVAAFFLYTKLRTIVARQAWLYIYPLIPKPVNSRSLARFPPPPAAETLTARDPALPGTESEWIEGQPRNGHDISRDEPTIRALEGQAPPEHAQLGTIRRQSTFSSRGDEYASDEEEAEIVNATLISFDVEATDASDTPPGVWSAELRPNVAADPRNMLVEEPLYADNALSRLPSIIATDVFTVSCSYLIVAPYEAFALRLLARSVRQQQGLPFHDIYAPSPWASLSLGAFTNFLGVEVAHLCIESEIWGAMTTLADLYRGCQVEWSFWRVLRHKFWESELTEEEPA